MFSSAPSTHWTLQPASRFRSEVVRARALIFHPSVPSLRAIVLPIKPVAPVKAIVFFKALNQMCYTLIEQNVRRPLCVVCCLESVAKKAVINPTTVKLSFDSIRVIQPACCAPVRAGSGPVAVIARFQRASKILCALSNGKACRKWCGAMYCVAPDRYSIQSPVPGE
jgi:hypothetical protein